MALRNVALAGTPTATQSDVPTNPFMAINNITAPFCTTGGGTFYGWEGDLSSVFKIDLGAVRAVEQIDVISTQNAYDSSTPATANVTTGSTLLLTDYVMKISLDDSSYTTLETVASNNIVHKRFTYSPTNIRYIKFEFTGGGGSKARINELQVWANVDADLPVELTGVGARLLIEADLETGKSDGDAVVPTDFAGNIVLAQPDAAKKPTFKTAIFNGLPVFRLDGADFVKGGDVLDIGADSFTTFVVGKRASGNGSFFAKSVFATEAGRRGIFYQSANLIALYQNNDDIQQVSVANSSTDFQLIEQRCDRTTGKNQLYINNSLVSEVTFTPESTNFDTTRRLLIGAFNDVDDTGETLQLTGDIAAIIELDNVDPASINAVRNYFAKYGIEPIPQLKTFGDSITVGSNASTAPQRYVNLLTDLIGAELTNYGVSGDMIPDQQLQAYSAAIVDGDIVTLMLGTNDERYYETADQLLDYEEMQLALAAWLTIPYNYKLTARDAALTYTGTWANDDYFGIGKQSATNGDKVSFDIDGDRVIICHRAFKHGTTNEQGTAVVKCDTIEVGNLDTQYRSDITSQNGRVSASRATIISGLGAGAHTIEIELDSTTGQIFHLDWVCSLDEIPEGLTNVLLLANCIRMKAQGYIDYGGSEENVVALGAIAEENVARLRNNLLWAENVDLYSVIIPADHIAGDNIHANDAGHDIIADTFFGAYDARTAPTEPSLTITPTTLDDGIINTPYEQTTAISASGGTAPYTYSLDSGTPPDGMSFNTSTKKFEGTPIEFGTFSGLVVKAIDDLGVIGTRSYTIEILDVDTTDPTGSITSPEDGDIISGTVNVLISATDDRDVDRVQLMVDDLDYSVPDTVSPYSVAVDTTQLEEGDHTFKAVIYDTSNNSFETAEITATVRNIKNLSWTSFNLVNVPLYIAESGTITVETDAEGVALADGKAFFVRYFGIGHEDEGTYETFTVTLDDYEHSTALYAYELMIAKREGALIILRDGRTITIT